MTTIAALRTDHANRNLGRVDGSAVPWADADINAHLVDSLRRLWPEVGKFTSGTMAPSQASDVYTLPAAFTATDYRISRIELEQSTGGVSAKVDEVSVWQRYSATQIRIRPRLPTDATLTLRVFGWIPYLDTASDLPVRLERPVADRAVGEAFGQLAAQLTNYQRQQGLDNGRVVDYPTAVGLAAYWERRYVDAVERDQDRLSYAPRRGRR